MKHLFWLLAFVSLGNTCVKAQGKLPPAYEIKADTSAYMEVPDKNWQILEDPTGKLTIGQVSSPAFDTKFHINNTRTKGYDYHVTNYWLRYTFKNTLKYPVKLAIEETVAEAYLYTRKADSTWTVEMNGTTVPYAQRAGLKRDEYFVETIQPGQQITFYEKDIFDFWLTKPKAFIMHVGFADAVIEKIYFKDNSLFKTLVIYSVVFGVLILSALINLMFYRIVREKMYLFFSLFLFCLGIWALSSPSWMLFEHHIYLYRALNFMPVIGFFFFLMHFIRNYLSTPFYTPEWDKFLIILSWILAIGWSIGEFLPTALNYKTFDTIGKFTAIIVYSYLPIIIGTTLFFLRKNKAAKPGIVALIPIMFWMGFGYMFFYICDILYREYKVPYPRLYNWMVDWNDTALLVCLLWLVFIFSWILFKRYQDLQQSLVQSSLDREIERSQLIEQQNTALEQQVEARTAELKKSVDELKTTQQQLIQSEKLASLGELTAGIAHEIQNPLNFVNNFSEVSMELTVEMKEELQKGNAADAAALADDIEQNLEKIIHHGKRADAIVKNMLQHSRNNTAEKQLTDINALADEYLRLSYHGLRAKDKTFNSGMAAHLDPALPKVTVISQDIGRVLLNLFNNAFYAVQQRHKAEGAAYKPMVEVTTETFTPPSGARGVKIHVRDNGMGIPEAVKGKILQPFFTTKPTGEGTGLGLSLSYDIVVKGHGGKMEIFSEEGVYTEFVVCLLV